MSAPSSPWAWLGLLKWSLTYSDGTRSSDLSPMSPEDREFLEKVMREGIIDENERMKVILRQVADQMEVWKQDQDSAAASTDAEETVATLLQELRDIVEQIDYARAFAALKGITFLLGCIQESSVPISIRTECCGIMATMAQHNPPVQKEMLQAGALKILTDEYFDNPQQLAFQARLIQAMSAIVRQNTLAEAVFCKLEQAVPLFQSALRKEGTEALRKRALFFLSALLTSDDSDQERIELFDSVLSLVYTNFLAAFVSLETREMSLSMMQQLLERNLMQVDLPWKRTLAAIGAERLHTLSEMEAEEADLYASERQAWEGLVALLG